MSKFIVNWTLDHPHHTSARSRAFYQKENVGSLGVIHRHFTQPTVASSVLVWYVVTYSSLGLVANSDVRFLRSVFQTGNNLQISEKLFEERVAFETVEQDEQKQALMEEQTTRDWSKFEDIFENNGCAYLHLKWLCLSRRV
jgi:hypothetical protein